ncbi:hypothetical protein RRG08_051652 [Elysia crispata]|uniref:Uncharacterized protein n=1 Tax=Elysia crispata TaxID=231223 RepID=A0AAE1A2H5_9GAST|nr:hypothetical protein RRG08_051652 [Elysia crispata]
MGKHDVQGQVQPNSPLPSPTKGFGSRAELQQFRHWPPATNNKHQDGLAVEFALWLSLALFTRTCAVARHGQQDQQTCHHWRPEDGDAQNTNSHFSFSGIYRIQVKQV